LARVGGIGPDVTGYLETPIRGKALRLLDESGVLERLLPQEIAGWGI
jgi:hypothetical protein